MRQSLVVGNWKMNGSFNQLQHLLNELLHLQLNTKVQTVVCPVSIYLAQAKHQLAQSHIAVGAQNVSAFECGAYTGELSAKMLVDVAVKYCIVGHSERRALFAENNTVVAEKVKRCLEQGITPIICIGEDIEQRKADQTLAEIAKQVNAVVQNADVAIDKLVFAYEPLWAIGSGVSASPEQAQQVHACIRTLLGDVDKDAAQRVRILYGGSVKADNAKALFSQPDIDGGLVGGASLQADSFAAIVEAAG